MVWYRMPSTVWSLLNNSSWTIWTWTRPFPTHSGDSPTAGTSISCNLINSSTKYIHSIASFAQRGEEGSALSRIEAEDREVYFCKCSLEKREASLFELRSGEVILRSREVILRSREVILRSGEVILRIFFFCSGFPHLAVNLTLWVFWPEKILKIYLSNGF